MWASTSSKDRFPQDAPPPGVLRAALVKNQLKILEPVARGVAVLFVLMALLDPFLAPGKLFAIVFTNMFEGIVGLCWGVFAFQLSRSKLPAERSQAWMAVLVLLIFCNSILHMLLLNNPLESIGFPLVLMAASVVFVSRLWFFGVVITGLSCWVLTMLHFPTLPFSGIPWGQLSIDMGTMTILALVIFYARLGMLKQLESLRWQGDRQRERLEAVALARGAFVNSVSHELRTPLTSIVGYTEFLEDLLAGPLTPQQTEFVRQIQLGAYRLSYLVDDLLDDARLDAGTFNLKVEEADLGACIKGVAASLSPQAQAAHIRLELDLPGVPLVFPFDAQRIEQVLGNLLGNALKFTPANGIIQVRIQVEKNYIVCEVSDTGPGIALEDRAKLFQRFSQLSDGAKKGGTGLGLSISKAIIEAHGGEIGVRNTTGPGTTFYFTLPFVHAAIAFGTFSLPVL
jgi:signal transduction histidine kinase